MPAAGGRVAAVDALRGFALGGILLMNIEFFTRPLQGIALGFDPQWQGLDRIAGLFVATFVQGKFWTLFSLLFGMGFAVMFERAQAARASFDAMFARRLAGLLAIGAVHASLVWAGDILVPYALAGTAMWLLYRSIPAAQLWRVGLAAYLVPLVLMWTSVLTLALMPQAYGGGDLAKLAAESAKVLRDEYAHAAQVYAQGSYVEVVAQRVSDSLTQYSWFLSILPSIFGVFLIGAWLQRAGVLREPERHRPFLRRTFQIALPVGALFAIAGTGIVAGADATVLTPRLALGVTFSNLANLLLCAAYGSAFLLAATKSSSRPVPWFAPAGRMALTNYLLQSLVFTTIFYGYGLGLWGEVPRAAQVAVALAFFALQLAWSRAWMARFRHGPVEWLWRALTYLHLPAMRR